MPKLHSSRHIVTVLEQNGFFFVSQKGSHAKYRRTSDEAVYTVIIPMNKKEIPLGTFRSIVRQSGMDKKEFE